MSSNSLRKKRVSISENEAEKSENKPNKSSRTPKKCIKISGSLYKKTKPDVALISDDIDTKIKKKRKKSTEHHYRTRQSSESSSNCSVADGNFKRISVPYKRIKRRTTISSSETEDDSKKKFDKFSMISKVLLKRLDETNPFYFNYLQRTKNCDRRNLEDKKVINGSVKTEKRHKNIKHPIKSSIKDNGIVNKHSSDNASVNKRNNPVLLREKPICSLKTVNPVSLMKRRKCKFSESTVNPTSMTKKQTCISKTSESSVIRISSTEKQMCSSTKPSVNPTEKQTCSSIESSVNLTEKQTCNSKSSELTVKIPEKKKTQALKLRRDSYNKINEFVIFNSKTESNNNLQTKPEIKTEDTIKLSPSEDNNIYDEDVKEIKTNVSVNDFSEEELHFSSDEYDTDSTVTSRVSSFPRDSRSSFLTERSWRTYESDEFISRRKLNLSRLLSTSSASLNSTGSTENTKKKKQFKSIDKHLTTVDDALKIDNFVNEVQRYSSLDDHNESSTEDYETNVQRVNRCNSNDSNGDVRRSQENVKHVLRFSSPAKRPPKSLPQENKEFKVPLLPKRKSVDNKKFYSNGISTRPFQTPSQNLPEPESEQTGIKPNERPSASNPIQTKPPICSVIDKEDTISLYAETICTLPVDEPQMTPKLGVETEKYDVFDWISKCTSETDLETKEIETTPIEPVPIKSPVESIKNYNETIEYDNIFQYICPKILSFGSCRRAQNCSHVHDLPCNWENIIENMPANEISSLYDELKNKKYLYVYKKIFKYVTSTLGRTKDLNKLTRLSEDVMLLNMDTDCTPFIISIVQAIESSEITFQSAIDLVYKRANLDVEKKNTLADILLYVIVDHESPLEDNWMNVQMLVKNRSNLDPGFVQDILSNALKEPINEFICAKIYRDILSKIPDTHLRHIFHTVIDKYVKLLENINMKDEASCLYKRWKAQNESNGERMEKTIENQSEMESTVLFRKPNQTVPLMSQTVPLPNQAVPLMSLTVPLPSQTVPLQNQTITLQNQMVTLQNQTVSLQNQYQRSISEPSRSQQSEFIPGPSESLLISPEITTYPHTLFSNTPPIPYVQNRPNYFPNSPIRPDIFNTRYQRPSFSNDQRNWRPNSVPNPNQKYRQQNFRSGYQDRRKYNQNQNHSVQNTEKPTGPIDLKKIPRENYGAETSYNTLRSNENKSYFTQDYINQNTRHTSQKSNVTVINPQDGGFKTIEVVRHTISDTQTRISDDSDYENHPEFNGRSNDITDNHSPISQNATYIPTAISKIKKPNESTPFSFQNKSNDFSRHEIEQAFSSENTSIIFSLIQKHKNNIDQFLTIAVDMLLNQSHNLPTFFNTLSEKLILCFNTDNETKHVIVTIGMNIMMSEIETKRWNDAIKIMRLIDQYPNKELCKIYHREYSIGKKILALCHVMIHSESSVELDRAWRLIKDGKFHQIYQNWMYDSVETDKKYRDQVVDDYFSIMNKKNHIVLDILISLVEQEHNDICVSKYIDNAIILAINNNCTATRLLNLHFTYMDWVNHVQDTTFRALTIKMVKEKWLNPICFDLYEKGVLMEIYPQYLGNESTIILNSNLCSEEIQVIIESFLLKRQRCNIDTPIKIQAKQVVNERKRRKYFPKNLTVPQMTIDEMKICIINVCREKLRLQTRLNEDCIVIETNEIKKHTIVNVSDT